MNSNEVVLNIALFSGDVFLWLSKRGDCADKSSIPYSSHIVIGSLLVLDKVNSTWAFPTDSTNNQVQTSEGQQFSYCIVESKIATLENQIDATHDEVAIITQSSVELT